MLLVTGTIPRSTIALSGGLSNIAASSYASAVGLSFSGGSHQVFILAHTPTLIKITHSFADHQEHWQYSAECFGRGECEPRKRAAV